MSISKSQWKEIEDELAGFVPNLSFSLNGHEIIITRRRMTESKIVLIVIIDDAMKREQNNQEHDMYLPVTELLWRKRSRSLYSPKGIKKLEKDVGKRRAKKLYTDLHDKRHWKEPIFITAKSLVSQYKKIDNLIYLGPKTQSEENKEVSDAA
jgi:hypothetical protein